MSVPALFRVLDPDSNPVDGVTVSVYHNGSFVVEGLTGNHAPGEVQFDLTGSVAGEPYTVFSRKDGMRDDNGPEVVVSILEPDTTPNIFENVMYYGPSEVLATLHAINNGNPEPDVRFFIYKDGAYLTEVASGSTGDAVAPLAGSADPGTAYVVRAVKSGMTADDPAATIRVMNPLVAPALNEFDFQISGRTLPETTDPNMCRVSGYLVDASNRPARNVKIRFLPVYLYPELNTGIMYPGVPSAIGEALVASAVFTVTGADGYAEIDLPRNGLFEVHVYGLENPSGIVSRVHVADSASMALLDMLLPYVTSVQFTPTSLNMAVDGVATVQMAASLSDGSVITDLATLKQFVSLSSEYPEIATITEGEEMEITIAAFSAGSTDIVAERLEERTPPRIPALSVVAGSLPVQVA